MQEKGGGAMGRNTCKVYGLAIACFSLGMVVQILLPDIFIVMILACALLAVGVLLLKGRRIPAVQTGGCHSQKDIQNT